MTMKLVNMGRLMNNPPYVKSQLQTSNYLPLKMMDSPIYVYLMLRAKSCY